jgi:lipoprotein
MNKLTKVSALLFTSALLLAACGQDKKEETTVASTQAPTTQATTQATTTTPATTTAQAQTTVAKSDAKDGEVAFERINGNNITKVKITFKDGLIQKMTTDSIIDFDISGLPETSKEAFKQALQTQKQTMEQNYNQLKEQIKDVTGLKLDIRMEGTKYIQSYEVDYSNVNFDQLREIDPDFTSKKEATNYDQIIQSLLDAGFTRVN